MKSGQAGNVKQPIGLRNAGKKNQDEKSQDTEWKLKVPLHVLIIKRCWKRKPPDIRRFYSPSPHLLQTPESSGPVGGAGAPGAAAANASWFKHTSPHTHQHMHICTGNLLNPRSLSIFAAFRRTQKAEGNFETWPASVNMTALNHMADEAISPIDYWLSKVAKFSFKSTQNTNFQLRLRSPTKINHF